MSERPLPGLRVLLAITDFGFLAYWSVTALAAMSILNIPAKYLYRGYHDPMLVAWNWSFAPLDIVASIAGLWALAALRANRKWRGLAVFSLALTSTAGAMAIAFWALSGDFDWSWWTPNLFLLLWPWLYLPRLISE
jgi:hypothetical protein